LIFPPLLSSRVEFGRKSAPSGPHPSSGFFSGHFLHECTPLPFYSQMQFAGLCGWLSFFALGFFFKASLPLSDFALTPLFLMCSKPVRLKNRVPFFFSPPPRCRFGSSFGISPRWPFRFPSPLLLPLLTFPLESKIAGDCQRYPNPLLFPRSPPCR